MRARNFFMFSETKSSDGSLIGISCSDIIDSQIGPTNTTFVGITLKGDADNDPYGNVNVYSSGRNVNHGSVSSITFEKSEVSIGTTDSVDIVAIVARG